MNFKEALKPGYLGKLRVKNRIKLASTTTLFGSEGGGVTSKEIAFLAERARGGAGIVTTQGLYVHPTGRALTGSMNARDISNCDDTALPGLGELARAIKNNGSIAICQLLHYGRYSMPERGWPVLDVSGVPPFVPRFRQGKAVTKEEIREINNAYADAAERAQRAGFDGVEVLSFFHESFHWPFCNLRTDEYGGSLENKARAVVEMMEGIKRKVGKDYPVIMRLHGDGVMPDGSTPESFRKDVIQVAKWLEQVGMDAISLMIGGHESGTPSVTRDNPPGHWLYVAEAMKKALKVPVMMSFRLTPEVAEKALEEGTLDFWEMCRQLICDPEIPRKLEEGRPEDIVPCITCNECFNVFNNRSIRCTVNPRVGKEADEKFRVNPSTERKRVLVIGGGPGGMEAALIAAKRGHDVTLLEKKPALGGQLLLAAKTPHFAEMGDLAKSLSVQLDKAGVKVRTNQNVSASSIAQAGAQVVVVASGSSITIPKVQKEEGSQIFTAQEVLAGEVEVGKRIIVWGGNKIGLQTAEFLASQGRQVTIVDGSQKLGKDVSIFDRHHFLKRLKKAGVKIFAGADVKEVKSKEVALITNEGEEKLLADAVVVAKGRKANKEFEGLRLENGTVYQLGDCVAPRIILSAIHEGFQAGLKI